MSAVLLVQILLRLHGHFSYCVDDAYIHLALSQRLAHGLYGINAGEPASPSSSILWPLLFVPFAGTRVLAYLPLVVNLLCSGGTAWLLGSVVDGGGKAGGRVVMRWSAWLLGILLLFATNLFGLLFLGLEHPLEVLLSVCCAVGLVRLARGMPLPWWMPVAAAIVPSVRYEGLLITVCSALALWLAGRRRIAAAVLAVSVLPVVGFGLFLRHLGLPFVPISVLAKSTTRFATGAPRGLDLLRMVKGSVLTHLRDPERFSVLLLLVVLGWFAYRFRGEATRQAIALAGALACFVHLCIGPYGWFYRYELYCVSFALVLAVGFSLDQAARQDLPTPDTGSTTLEAVPRAAVVPGGLLAAVGALALFYMNAVLSVPQTAAAIYEQQEQVGRFTRDFYPGPVALHDLGWIAFGRTPQQYTMDLEGLGSYEAFRQRGRRSPAWFEAVAREHGIGLAVLNPLWFGNDLPASWKPLAKLCAVSPADDFGLVSPSLVFFATPEGDPQRIAAELAAFRPTLPRNVPFELAPSSIQGPCR